MVERNSDTYRFLAFYLPQFYPIPENDKWWGKGFTDWFNVVKTTPRFSGHYQPHLPTELSFYDLRVPEVRDEQAALAAKHGVSGFVYYHYWFLGHRVLNRPFDDMLASGSPDFPFCLCWANESWSRKWGPTYGSRPINPIQNDVLIQQRYTDEDHLEHIRWLGNVFKDPRYIRIQNKPLFLVFRASLIPDIKRITTLWREEARNLGIGEIYLAMVQAFSTDCVDPTSFGFDAGVPFQPNPRLRERVTVEGKEASSENIFSYEKTVDLALSQELPPFQTFPCIMPSWDNSARRSSGATIYLDAKPELFGKWARGALLQGFKKPNVENIIFINAWNEWAEGCHLEPDIKWGRGYLESLSTAISQLNQDRKMNLLL